MFRLSFFFFKRKVTSAIANQFGPFYLIILCYYYSGNLLVWMSSRIIFQILVLQSCYWSSIFQLHIIKINLIKIWRKRIKVYQLDAFNFPGFSKNGEKKISLPHFLYLYLFCVCVCVRERERETERQRENVL